MDFVRDIIEEIALEGLDGISAIIAQCYSHPMSRCFFCLAAIIF